MVMMTDAVTETLYVVIALGLIVPMALFAVKIDVNGISSVWEFRGKIFRVIKFVSWSDVVRVEVTEKFFYKLLKNIYVIPHAERKGVWREYESAVGFNSMVEDCREIGRIIASKVPEEVDKNALADFMKSLEPKPKP
jgi:hypothetical protein